jgi:hypothetical protein
VGINAEGRRVSRFEAAPEGGATARFAPGEVRILTNLAGQLVELVETRAEHGNDPAITRLLPDGYRENAEDAAEFRRFTEGDLADGKMRNAHTVLDSLSAPAHWRRVHVTLDAQGVAAWLRTLTDLRLTLAARLGVQPDGTLPPGSDAMTRTVYNWLGYLQESLVEAIDI